MQSEQEGNGPVDLRQQGQCNRNQKGKIIVPELLEDSWRLSWHKKSFHAQGGFEPMTSCTQSWHSTTVLQRQRERAKKYIYI